MSIAWLKAALSLKREMDKANRLFGMKQKKKIEKRLKRR